MGKLQGWRLRWEKGLGSSGEGRRGEAGACERSWVSAAGWGRASWGWGWRRGGNEQGQARHDLPGTHKPLQKKQAIFLGWAGLPEGVMFKLRPVGGLTRPGGEEQAQRPRPCRGRRRGEGQREGQTAWTPQAGVEGGNGPGMVGANAQAQVGAKPCSERLTNPAVSRIQAGHRQGLVSPGF